MSRLTAYMTGYGDGGDMAPGFNCVGWDAPVYDPMNGEGTECDDGKPLNRYLNFPSKVLKDVTTAPRWGEFFDMKDDLKITSSPDVTDYDPFNGLYVNLATIASNDGLSDRFRHICFPLNQCDPAIHAPGHISPPVPFIHSQKQGGGSDPGLDLITIWENFQFSMDDGFCLQYEIAEYERAPGNSQLTELSRTSQEICVDTTDCPPA